MAYDEMEINMAEFLREWTMTLAGIIVFGSLCEMILPGGVYKKYIHLAIGLMLCLAVLSPLASKKTEVDISFMEPETYAMIEVPEEAQRNEVLRIYKDNLCKNMTEEVKKYSDLEFDIKCDVSEDEDSFGVIKNVWITVDADRGERLDNRCVDALKNIYGIDDGCISIKYLG